MIIKKGERVFLVAEQKIKGVKLEALETKRYTAAARKLSGLTTKTY